MSDNRCLKSDIWNKTSEIRQLTSGVWYQRLDIRRLTTDSWHQTSEIRHLTSDFWYQMPKVRRLTKRQLTCSQRQWLHSSIGRASHRYREVTGSNLIEVLNCFKASLCNCINCVHCDNHFFIFIIFFRVCSFGMILMKISDQRWLGS